MSKFLYLIILSSSSFVALFIIAKMLGKKQVAQLEFIDYVVGISIGSIAGEMATDIDQTPLYYYLVAMAIYFVLDFVVSFFARKSPALKHFFKGRPLTIIYNGQIDYKTLKKSKLDVNDVIELARSKGYFNLEDIAFAIFENNGELSIMPKSQKQTASLQDLQIKTPPAELPIYLVADGIISKSSLNQINKDIKWLYKKLNISKKNELKNILIASYDNEKDIVSITKKNKN